MLDFNSILNDYGFSADNYDFESTIIGFSYDIESALWGSDSIFVQDQCQIIRNWDDPSAYIHAHLVTVDGDVEHGTKYLLHRWKTEIRYGNPVVEVIDTRCSGIQTVIRILTITNSNAMTLKFTI